MFLENAALFDKGALCGVCSLKKAGRVHLLTATATDFLFKLTKTLQTNPGVEWNLEFKSKSGYTSNSAK